MVDALDTGGDGTVLREYLRVLRRRWALILLIVSLAVGAAVAYSLSQPVQYVATAEVLVQPTTGDVGSTGTAEVTAEEMATQVEIVTSLPVATLVRERLRLAEVPELSDVVTAEVMGNSRIMRVTATASRPERAALIANGVAKAYVTYRSEESGRRFAQAAASLSAHQRAVEDRIDAIDQALLEEPTNRVELEAERRNLLTQLGQIASQIGAVDSSVASGGGGTLLQAAEPPAAPVTPRPLMDGLLAVFVGLLLGIAVAVLRDRLDEIVRDEETVRRALGRAPLLGRIPRWDDSSNRGRLVTLLSPYSAASEAYQTLSVNVRFLLAASRRPATRGGVVLTTSAQTGEGKTVTAANLAVAAAKVGMRVILVDADLRRALVADRFGLGRDVPGLSDLLVSSDEVGDSLIDVGIENLRVLPAGTIPPNPTELLASPRMRMVLQEIARDADLVVLDSPPALVVADALELVGAADLTIVVARQGYSHRRALASVVERLRQVGAEAVGGVVNHIDAGDSAKAPYPYEPLKAVSAADEKKSKKSHPSARSA